MSRTRDRRGRILVFGENRNDSRSIRELMLAANPALDARLVVALPRPQSLTREAKPDAVRNWVRQIEEVVRGYAATTPVTAVVVHRDADVIDPDGNEESRLAGQLRSVSGRPAVPVQAIEAWWFLFPDAVESVRPGAWKGCLPRSKRDVEKINDPKAELCRATRTPRAPEYAEADSVVIAAAVRTRGLAPIGTSTSYLRFQETARAIG